MLLLHNITLILLGRFNKITGNSYKANGCGFVCKSYAFSIKDKLLSISYVSRARGMRNN